MKYLTIAVAAGVWLSGTAYADTQPEGSKTNFDGLYLPYEQPGIFTKLATGETIHIKCMGAGSPTVILTAAFGGTGRPSDQAPTVGFSRKQSIRKTGSLR